MWFPLGRHHHSLELLGPLEVIHQKLILGFINLHNGLVFFNLLLLDISLDLLLQNAHHFVVWLWLGLTLSFVRS